MGLSLSNILTKANMTNTQTDAATAASVSHVAKNLRGAMILDSLQVGQTISGQIKEMNGSQILLDIGNGVEVNAKLENALDVAVGKSLMFEIKSHAGDKISLSPLYTNLSTDGNAAYSALKAANMPFTEANVAMAKTMMEEGMSVDKTSLWQMGKTVAAFKGASPETIVHLKAMGLEINSTNIAGYEAAVNMQHKLTDGATQFLNGLQEVMTGFAEQGNITEGLQFMEQALQVLGANGEAGTTETVTESTQNPAEQNTIGAENSHASSQAVGAENGLKELQGLMKELSSQIEMVQNEETVGDGVKQTGHARVLPSDDGTKNIQRKTEMSQIPDKGNDLIHSDRFTEIVQRFNKEIAELLKNNWAIEPESFADKEEVKEFYKDLQKQLNDMEQLLTSHGKENTTAAKTLQNMNQNLQFMQNMNQVFPYLQIPLKAAMENAHGELYVYSRQKGKVSEDGSSSALLHLDMQHLGPLDVYVKLKDMNVSTQFTLADEATLDFIAAHMDLLTQRLEDKGYRMDSQVKVADAPSDEANVIHRIRGIEEEDMLVSYTSFDVRA